MVSRGGCGPHTLYSTSLRAVVLRTGGEGWGLGGAPCLCLSTRPALLQPLRAGWRGMRRQGPGLRFLGQQQKALLPGPLGRKGHRGGSHQPNRETQTDVMGSPWAAPSQTRGGRAGLYLITPATWESDTTHPSGALPDYRPAGVGSCPPRPHTQISVLATGSTNSPSGLQRGRLGEGRGDKGEGPTGEGRGGATAVALAL